MRKTLTIISGIIPGYTGVGRLMSYLSDENLLRLNNGLWKCKFFFRGEGGSYRRYFKEKTYLAAARDFMKFVMGGLLFKSGLVKLLSSNNVLLVHPQTLGHKWCIDFIEETENQIWLYLMDCSFFCLRQYNFIPETTEPCLKCLGGDFEKSKRNNCLSRSGDDLYSSLFLEKMIQYVQDHRIKLIAQNVRQASLARRHFGEKAVIEIAGLWSGDWDLSNINNTIDASNNYDIVFHGIPDPAKGVFWALRVARYLPQYSFLFPFAKHKIADEIPVSENCIFKEMYWESGLQEAVVNSRLVLAPSLWSAPIEGALIKSIALAKLTAVVENKTSFSDELPDNIVVKLSPAEETASTQIHQLLSIHKLSSKIERDKFIYNFEHDNKDLLSQLCCLTLSSQ